MVVISLVILASLFASSSQDVSKVKFLGQTFALEEWKRIQGRLSDVFGNGKWENITEKGDDSLTDRACTFEHPFIERYKRGRCAYEQGNRGHLWKWAPNNGTVLDWDVPEMCKILQGRNILFVGDSTQSSFFFTYVSVVLAQTIQSKNATIDQIKMLALSNENSCEKLCEWGTYNWNHGCEMLVPIFCGADLPPYGIAFVRNDNFNGGHGWMSHISRLNATILFMNTGAHYQPDSSLLNNLKSTLSALTAQYPQVSVFYRNTPHGHPNCHLLFNSGPINNDSTTVTSSLDSFALVQPNYQWNKFVHQNKLVQALFEEYFPSVILIDVATSTNLRGDSHIDKDDCLHYCIPGPTHSWVFLHFQALKMIIWSRGIINFNRSALTTYALRTNYSYV